MISRSPNSPMALSPKKYLLAAFLEGYFKKEHRFGLMKKMKVCGKVKVQQASKSKVLSKRKKLKINELALRKIAKEP